MDSNKLREKFIKFFVERGHKHLKPASLIPKDQSVLFTTAGMQQFKKYYTHPDEAPAKNVVTIQFCFRTSDIDEVGDEAHLTFFEMLGSFSFGGYGKKEAIKYAWEFLTKILKIEKPRISATYFGGSKDLPEDEESLEILKDIGGLKKIKPQNFKENFWSLGTEGSPGGPTVEFYINGVEIWNLVFNEYVFQNVQYRPSQYKGVDTGMGLERLAAVMQNKTDIYQTDLFLPIIQKIEEISGKKYKDYQKEFRIIADHIKAAVFAIADEVLPSNKERGYTVRRLIRRAVVKSTKLEIAKNFTSQIANIVFEIYQKFQEFRNEEIVNILNLEEEKFRKTLHSGLKLIHSKEKITGQDLFNFYQSFGIPSEITKEEARETQIPITAEAEKEYEKLFQKHQELSRTASAGMFKGGLASSGEMETKYHTATHLLLASLRQILGRDVHQRGSNITAERLRFDFNCPEKLTPEQIKQVEDLVNKKIKEDLPVTMKEMTLDEAKKSGATGVFDLKYGEKVKVYTIGPSIHDAHSGYREFFSREICGGPHIVHSDELGHFKITKEESSSAGVRRIKAVLE